MPIVPRYDGQQVATAPLPGVRVSTGAPSAAFGTPAQIDTSGVQRVVQGIVDEEKAKADQVAVLDATNQLDKLHTDLSLGALDRKGKDAMGALQDVQAAWNKGTSEIDSGLTSERQRLQFEATKSNRWNSLYAHVEQHAHSESVAYDTEQANAFLENRKNDAIADPTKAPDAIAQGRAALADFAKRNGWAPEQLKEKSADFVSRVHVGVLTGMLANDQDQAATAYYTAHKDEVVGDARAQVEHALDVGSTLGESQRLSLDIVTKHDRMSDALAEVDKISDPKVQEATRRAVKERFTEREVQKREDYETLTDTAFGYLVKTGDVPAPLMAQLKPRDIIAINTYKKSLLKKEEPQTNWSRYYDLMSTASTPQMRDAFLTTNLWSDRHNLGDTEFKQLVELQASMRKADPNAEHQLSGVRTAMQVVNDALNGAGIDPTPKPGSNDATRVAEFRRQVDQQVTALEQTTKKKATAEDVQKITDRLMIRGVVPGSGFTLPLLGTFWTDTRRAFETPGQRLVIGVTDIPRAERAQIEAALTRRKLPVTPQSILELYKKQHPEVQ